MKLIKTIKFIHTLCLLSVFSMLLSTPAWSEVAVIVHPSVGDSASTSDISRIFLGKAKSLPGGTKVIPVNLERGSATREEFNEKVLGKSGSQLKSYWSRLVFTGKAQPPKDTGTDKDVIDLIKSNPNIIGYVSADKVTADVKVLATF